MIRALARVTLGLALLSGAAAVAGDAAGACHCGTPPCNVCELHRTPRLAGRPTFDPKAVTEFEGPVTAVERVEHGQGFVGVHLRVKSGAETVVVHLGPASFVDPKARFAVDDLVAVRGSRVTFRGEPTLLAVAVKRGPTTLELRREDGTPLFPAPAVAR